MPDAPGDVEPGFVGAWRFDSATFVGTDGTVRDPYGPDAAGLVIYEHGGAMAVQLMAGDRTTLGSDDVHLVAPERVVAAMAGLTTYYGTWVADPGSGVVAHTIERASHPDWDGRVLRRRYRFEGDRLVLTTLEPFVAGGVDVTGTLVWRRP